MTSLHVTAVNVSITPQTVLALMGFSRYRPSYLDLTDFVVRGHGGATAEPARSLCRLSLADSLESGNLEIQESGIHKNQKFKNSQNENLFCPKLWQVLD